MDTCYHCFFGPCYFEGLRTAQFGKYCVMCLPPGFYSPKKSELCPRRAGDTKARALPLVIRHHWEAHSTHPSLSLSSWEKHFAFPLGLNVARETWAFNPLFLAIFNVCVYIHALQLHMCLEARTLYQASFIITLHFIYWTWNTAIQPV